LSQAGRNVVPRTPEDLRRAADSTISLSGLGAEAAQGLHTSSTAQSWTTPELAPATGRRGKYDEAAISFAYSAAAQYLRCGHRFSRLRLPRLRGGLDSLRKTPLALDINTAPGRFAACSALMKHRAVTGAGYDLPS